MIIQVYSFLDLIYCILIDSSTVIICWTSSFVILGLAGLLFAFILLLMENLDSKRCRP